jgi:hypothetical protein
MSLISTLFHGPEYAFGEKFTQEAGNISSISVEPYSVNPGSSDEVVTAMQSIYARQRNPETTYVTRLSQPKSVIHASALVQSRFSKSSDPTDYYLIDHSIVVSIVKREIDKSSQRGGVQHDDSLKVMVSFGALDHSIKEMTGPLLKILPATQRWFESMYVSLIALSMGVGAVNTVLFVVSTTLLTKAVFISLIGLQALAAYRIYQLSPLKEKVSRWVDFGQFASQIRRWSYEYPQLSSQNPFLLPIEKQGLAH